MNHRATLDFSGRVNRDQRDRRCFSATVQGGDYPHSLKADFTQLSWQLRGAELPPDGINGREYCLQASWQEDDKTLRFDNLNLMAAAAPFRAAAAWCWRSTDWSLDLHATTLDLIVCWRKGRRRRTVAPVSRARVRRDRCAGDRRQR